MKILISNDGPTAFYYIRTGLARAFAAAGHGVMLWDINQKPVMDAFDEFQPDLFLGQTYNTNREVVQAIKERPHMKVIMKAGDWGPLADQIPTDLYGVLMASKTEKHIIRSLYDETGKPDYVHIYYHPSYIGDTHGGWSDVGISVHSHMLAADIFDYTNGRQDERFKSDLTFIGGYWPYKARNIDDYLLPLCLDYKYKIKIFGNANWPVAQYCGFAPPDLVRDVLASATICPQLHEPHSTDYGFDMSERTFKLMSNKCFVISDYVAGLEILFGDSILMAKTPEKFRELVDHYLARPEERQQYIDANYEKVMNEHTYFHRAHDIFNNLNLDHYATSVLKVYNDNRKEIDAGNYINLVGMNQ